MQSSGAEPALGLSSLTGLYAIVDVDAAEARRLDWFTVAERIVQAGAPLVQFRAKNRPDAFVLEGLRRLRALVRSEGNCLLFANDRPDLAELSGADGVHLGQEDLPVARVKAHYPKLAIGLSTHDAAQFRAGLELTVEYLALGPIFRTSSKSNPEPTVGLGALSKLSTEAREAGMPVVAIGGIGLNELARVREHAPLVAAISALLPPPDFAGDAYAEVERLSLQFACAARIG